MVAQASSTRDVIPTLPGRLRELRELAGLTQGELATAAGTHQTTVAKLEGGRRAPSLRLAADLARALGVLCDALLDPPGSTIRRKSNSHKG